MIYEILEIFARISNKVSSGKRRRSPPGTVQNVTKKTYAPDELDK
jgi:hypothetical protein